MISNIKNNKNKKYRKYKKYELIENYYYYLMILPAAILFFLFSYLPLPGIVIAFKNYNVMDGIFGSPFVGLDNFRFYFESEYALRTTFNTFWINANIIFFGTIFAVGFAIMLNEIQTAMPKKIFQNLLFLPYFISAIVVGKFVGMLFKFETGIVNNILEFMTLDRINWYSQPQYWVKILVSTSIWKNIGYSMIIYLAAITGIDKEVYEASSIDGANKLQQIRYIMLPYLKPTIIILTLLSIGRIFYGDFQLIYAIIGENNGVLLETTDVIETYIYRAIRKSGDFSTAAAIGFYQSVLGFILVFGSNYIVKKYDSDNSLF